MEQHPIPQDVTGFQFKLIGNMTIKQFAYVAAGVISAVILYYLPLQGAFGVLIKVFFIPIFGGSGIAIAFLPIEGRPVDIMATNLVKALFSPNQYVYQKVGRTYGFTTISTTKVAALTAAQAEARLAHRTPLEISKERQLRAFLQDAQSTPKTKLDEKESTFLKAFAAIPTPVTPPTTQPMQPKMPTMTKPTPAAVAALAQQETVITRQLTQAKQEEQSQPPNPLSPLHQKVALLEKQVSFIHKQKEQLEQELAQLKAQLGTQQTAPAITPPPAPVALAKQTPVQTAIKPSATAPAAAPAAQPQAPSQQAQQRVRSIPQDMTKRMGLPHIPDTPNVIVGIVKDPRGNVIPNVLVEVKDKDGNPVRAFKTNPLGQFASATPLSAGNYTIELEDPKKQNVFDVIQIVINNHILPPIEVTSHDEREALRKALFN